MLILTQNKKQIINISQSLGIYLIADKGQYCIKSTDTSGYHLTLGIYPTEERAKAILQGILLSAGRGCYEMPER
jgi:hypothetical protein